MARSFAFQGFFTIIEEGIKLNNYLKNRLSVEGQARAVMIRFDEPTSCKRAFTALKANFGTIFPRFPNGEVKLVKPERKKNQFERAEPIISAFAAVEKME